MISPGDIAVVAVCYSYYTDHHNRTYRSSSPTTTVITGPTISYFRICLRVYLYGGYKPIYLYTTTACRRPSVYYNIMRIERCIIL